MKKAILSLIVLCVSITFSSEKLMSAASNAYQPYNKKLNSVATLNMKIYPVFSLMNLTPVTYRNLRPNAGHLVINDLTTSQTYSVDLPPTTGPNVGSTGISLQNGDQLEVTVYSGNGNCSIRCNGSTQTGVSSIYLSSVSFMPDPSWIVIQ